MEVERCTNASQPLEHLPRLESAAIPLQQRNSRSRILHIYLFSSYEGKEQARKKEKEILNNKKKNSKIQKKIDRFNRNYLFFCFFLRIFPIELPYLVSDGPQKTLNGGLPRLSGMTS